MFYISLTWLDTAQIILIDLMLHHQVICCSDIMKSFEKHTIQGPKDQKLGKGKSLFKQNKQGVSPQ